MADLKDAFSKLKSAVVKTQTQKIDAKLDTAVKDILTYKSHGGRNGYIDLVKSLISKSTHDVRLGGGTGGDLFNQGVGPATFGQGGRMMRYKTYQAIVSNISYCFRALQVLVENILSPDDITKVSLEVKPIEYIEDEIPTSARVKYVKEVLSKLKLEKRLDLIVRNTLLFGDFFCEIADPETALTSRSILTESEYNSVLEGQYKNRVKDKFTVREEKATYDISIDYSSFVEQAASKTKSKKDSKKEDFKRSLKELELVFHEPNYVLRLQSRVFPICFGFLIFPPQDMVSTQALGDQTVNNICIAILKNLEKKIPQVKELKADKELKDIISGMLAQTDMTKALEIRYVPPDKMTHFLMPTTKFYPYGESIFDSTQFSSKVLIALETALAIQRLSRSTEKRKIAIEVGLPRDARKAIESMKEEFRKRKVSLDSFGTVDTIPSMITTFEDVYIPQRDGKPFVDISTFTEGNVDTRSKVDEVKQMRDQLVASLGVPPSFIGIEENLSNKCLDLSTKIELLTGNNIKLADLINEFSESGTIEDKYTYSYDIENGKIVPGKIVWAGITRKNAKVVEVILDNEKFEMVTPDHHYMLRDGSYIEAKDLQPGVSLMPLYTKLTHHRTTKNIPYQAVYHPGINQWQETHRMVAIHEGIVSDGDKLNVHHMNFNPLNNSPTNLEGLTNKEHLNKHIEHKQFITTGRGNVKKENYIEQECVVCHEKYIKHIQNNQITCLKPECIKEIRRINGIKSFQKREYLCAPKILLICPFCKKEFFRTQKYIDNIKSGIITCGEKECYKKSFVMFNSTEERRKLASEAGKKGGNKSKNKLVEYNKIHGAPMKGRTKETHPEIFEMRAETLRRKQALNHKVISVEFLDYTIDTGDVTVEKYHNFAVSSGVIISNSALSEENILFARTIIRYQKFFTEQINDLITKIFDIINPEEALVLLDTVNISFPIPKSLQFERESRYMNELTNLVESLERIGIPKEYSKKRYLAHFDWEEIKKYEIDEKVEKTLDPTKKQEDELGGGLMGGVGGAPMPGGEF